MIAIYVFFFDMSAILCFYEFDELSN
jgi:hypothetical protein